MPYENADRSGGDDRCGCLPEFPNLFRKLTVWMFRVDLGKVTVLEAQQMTHNNPLHTTHRLGLVTLSAYHIIPITHQDFGATDDMSTLLQSRLYWPNLQP